MKRRILNSAIAERHRGTATSSLSPLVHPTMRPTVEPLAARVLPPLGVLWDPSLLSRLQAPLTRFRE